MKIKMSLPSVGVAASLALALLASAPAARANVYATDIKLNGGFSNVTNAAAGSVTVTYILNEPATAGLTVNILSGNTVVDTINITSPSAGTAMGSNTVLWGGTNSLGNVVGAGTYSVSITAAANGFTNWTQTSLDSTNNVAVDPEGIAVDNNTNSQYYGRVMVGCAGAGSAYGVAQLCGIYKMNADGSPADEGTFGFGGYTTNDSGETAVGQMNNSGSAGSGYNPWRLRIGEDDRLYMDDFTDLGAIIAFNMRVTTNQVVIDEGKFGFLGGPSNYTNNPDFNLLVGGINNFDVTATTTANAAVWLGDVDFPNWGIWEYRLVNGAADTEDHRGTQAVQSDTGSEVSDLSAGSVGGCMIDSNLDIFVSQNPPNAAPVLRSMEYTNWNKGVLPPEAGGSIYTYGTTTGQVFWSFPTSDASIGVQDTVINNRQHPSMVALPLQTTLDADEGISVLNASNGLAVLTNLDIGNSYTCAAWDNVGNLYGASPSVQYWRVWSPPGTNQATTAALAHVIILPPIQITGITASPTTPGAITITFTGPSVAASAYTLVESPTVNGAYAPANGASITGGSGAYQATFTNTSTEFYKIEGP